MSVLTPRWNSWRLGPDERPLVMYEYYATGQGPFPVDMLRYDCCWPANAAAAAAMLDRPMRSILMLSYRQPTLERWVSFLWSVGSEDLR